MSPGLFLPSPHHALHAVQRPVQRAGFERAQPSGLTSIDRRRVARLKMRSSLLRTFVAAFVMLAVALAAAAHARGVQLDRAFSPEFSDGRAAGNFTALQPDGNVIASNGRVRYLPNGTRDSSYALPPEIKLALNTWPAPDGRMFVRFRDAAGNDAYTILTRDGAIDAAPAATFETVRDAVFQPDGKLLVAADTFIAGGRRRSGLARFSRDGSLDPTFDTGAGPQGGGIETIALQADGKILVGGFFATFDNAPRRQFVRLSASGLVDPTFTAAVSNVVTAALALPTGRVLVYEAITRRVLRLNADGSLDRVIGRIEGGFAEVERFVLLPDGRALVIGSFDSLDGIFRRNLARLTVDGAVDRGFDASAALRSGVQLLANVGVQPDGKLFVGGNDVSDDRLVRLNGDGSIDPSFAPGAPKRPSHLATAVESNGRIVAVGTFSAVNGVARAGVARFLPDGTLDPSFAPSAPLVLADEGFAGDPNVTRLRVAISADGSVLVAGTVVGAGSSPRQGLVRYSSTGELDGSLAPTLSPGGTVRALALLPDGRIVLGGEFASVNGQPRANLAALRPDGTLDPSWGASAGANQAVHELATRPDGGVFAAGAFTLAGNERRAGLAAFNAAGALDTRFVPSPLTGSAAPTALASLPDGGVVIALPPDSFTGARARLLRLQPDGALDPTFVFPYDVNASFAALAAEGQGRVLAAYTAVETGDLGLTTTHAFMQRFGPTGAVDFDFNIGSGFSVTPSSIIVAPDGSVLVGGSFSSLDDLPVPALVRLLPGSTGRDRLLNISTRAETGPGARMLTAGFVIGGTVPKTVVVRAAGPSLGAFGVAGVIADPALTLIGRDGVVATNDNWSGLNPLRPQPLDLGFHAARTFDRVGAFALQPREAALVATLPPGSYTAQVRLGANEPPGVTLVEVYDANAFPDDRRLLNLSSRGTAGPGDRTLIAGFVIGGTVARTLLVRAIGPGLAPFNVEGTLADPTLTLVDAAGRALAINDDWSASANAPEVADTAARVGAFALPSGSKDSTLLVTLPPGNYTALVTGTNATSGIALVEVYEVP